MVQKVRFSYRWKHHYRRSEIYNRFVFVTPEKEIFFYDKRYTFTLANENIVLYQGAILEFLNIRDGRFVKNML